MSNKSATHSRRAITLTASMPSSLITYQLEFRLVQRRRKLPLEMKMNLRKGPHSAGAWTTRRLQRQYAAAWEVARNRAPGDRNALELRSVQS